MLDETAVTAIANEVLSRELANAGFARATVEARRDHDGEDALYVTITFEPDAPATTGKATIEARAALMQALQAGGDERFPYFVYDYPDDERPFDADLDAAE